MPNAGSQRLGCQTRSLARHVHRLALAAPILVLLLLLLLHADLDPILTARHRPTPHHLALPLLSLLLLPHATQLPLALALPLPVPLRGQLPPRKDLLLERRDLGVDALQRAGREAREGQPLGRDLRRDVVEGQSEQVARRRVSRGERERLGGSCERAGRSAEMQRGRESSVIGLALALEGERGGGPGSSARTHLVVPRNRVLHVAPLVLDDPQRAVRRRRARVELNHAPERRVRLVPLPAHAAREERVGSVERQRAWSCLGGGREREEERRT